MIAGALLRVTLTLAGLATGLLLAVAMARAMRTLFNDFPPDYLSADAIASLALLGVAALACIVPAHRASRIDPVVALQQE